MHQRIERRRKQLLASKRVVRNAHGEGGRATLGEITRRASMPPSRCRELVKILRRAPEGNALEFGSNVGISGAYMAAELAARGQRLLTVEGVKDLAEAATRTAVLLELQETMYVEHATFDEMLPRLQRGGWAFALLDGEHVADPTRRYAQELADRLRPGGILVIDDCSDATGLGDVFDEIRGWACWHRSWCDGRFGVLRKLDASPDPRPPGPASEPPL